jgi:hypothetical protein
MTKVAGRLTLSASPARADSDAARSPRPRAVALLP